MREESSSMTGAGGRPQDGGTLVEVMIACVVLAAIAITGATYLEHTRSILAVQRNRAVALAIGDSLVEQWRCQGYSAITQQMDVVPKYIGDGGGLTILEYWDVPELVAAGIGSGHDAVKITVVVTSRPPDVVSLTTIYSP